MIFHMFHEICVPRLFMSLPKAVVYHCLNKVSSTCFNLCMWGSLCDYWPFGCSFFSYFVCLYRLACGLGCALF